MIKLKKIRFTIIILSFIFLSSIFGFNFDSFFSNEKKLVSKEEENYFIVKSITDGDTIVVNKGEQDYKVRFIGINTPEIAHKQGQKNQCFGKEATDFTKEKLKIGSKIDILYDSISKKEDIYGRVLGYIILEDKTVLNEELVKNGFARVYRKANFAEMNKYLELEKQAKENKKGLWSSCQFKYKSLI